MARKKPTPGEALFEEYLKSQNLSDFEYEKDRPGKKKRPDYSLLFESIGFTGIPLLIVSAAAFGLAHIYQGFVGVIMAAIMGAFFTLIYIQTGSLWWSIVAHIFIDLRVLLIVAFAKKH